MKVEREFAGFAFPFAAAAAIIILSGGHIYPYIRHYHIIALTILLMSVILLMHHTRNDLSIRWQWTLVISCAAACGAFIGLCHLEIDVSSTPVENILADSAREFGNSMKILIDSIPFADKDTNAVVKALLTGDGSAITPQMKETFRNSGASHILALSGLHLGIIYGIIRKSSFVFGNSILSKRVRSVITVILCGFYTSATGAGASIVRAFIFITIKEIAELSGRRINIKDIFLTSLVLHMTISPSSVTSIGFQLSYAAIAGIAFIYPHLEGIWRNNWKFMGWIWRSAAVSISCQITTGPLAYFYFGTFPKYFIMTNLIAVPLTGLVIPSALATLVLTVTGYCPRFLINLTEFLASAMTDALSIIASM